MDSAELAVMEFGRLAVISKEAQGLCTSVAACSDLPYLQHHLPYLYKVYRLHTSAALDSTVLASESD